MSVILEGFDAVDGEVNLQLDGTEALRCIALFPGCFPDDVNRRKPVVYVTIRFEGLTESDISTNFNEAQGRLL